MQRWLSTASLGVLLPAGVGPAGRRSVTTEHTEYTDKEKT